MAPSEPSPAGGRGAATLVALCLTTALGVGVGSYLALFSRGRELGIRHLYQARVHELAQTGLEEALWALNHGEWTTAGPSNAAAWTTSGPARILKVSYPDAAPGAAGSLTVTVDPYAGTAPNWPVITAVASLTPPAGGAPLTRTLRATTAPAPLFGHAVASAEASVSFVAGGAIDSWNSDPDNNPATPAVDYTFVPGEPSNFAASVAGHDDGTNGVTLTQATVHGYVATHGQPVGYSISGAPRGRVLGPATPPGVDIDRDRISRTAFIPVAPVFAVTPPPTSGPAYGGLLGTVLALVNALLGAPPEVEVYRIGGDLRIDGIPLVSPNLVVDRPLKLIIDGNLTIANVGQITIQPGASLQMFVAGDCTIGGLGIDNQNIEPVRCAIFCSSSSTTDSLQYTTGSDFRGVIYCENKPIDIRQNANFFGALLSRQRVSFSAGATAPVVHYDLALRATRFAHVATPFIVTGLTIP